MKKCTYCGKEYENNELAQCEIDFQSLVAVPPPIPKLSPPRRGKYDTPQTVPFEDACQTFAALLASRGRPKSQRWFCREDVTAYRHRIRLLASKFDTNRALYESYYSYCAARGTGLEMTSAFFTKDESWCHIKWGQEWWEKDEINDEFEGHFGSPIVKRDALQYRIPSDWLGASQPIVGHNASAIIRIPLNPHVTLHTRQSLALWSTFDAVRGPSPLLAFVPRRSWLKALTP